MIMDVYKNKGYAALNPENRYKFNLYSRRYTVWNTTCENNPVTASKTLGK